MTRVGFAVGGLVFAACADPSVVEGRSAQTLDRVGTLVDEQLGCRLFSNNTELTIFCQQHQSAWGHPVYGEARFERVVVAGCQPALDNAYTCSMKIPVNSRGAAYGMIGWQRTHRHFRVDSATDGTPRLIFTKVALEPTSEARQGCFRAQMRSQARLSMSSSSQADRTSIPFFECFRGGPGLWTVVVRQAERQSCSAASCLRVELDVVAVSMDGTETSFAGPVGVLTPENNRLRWEGLDVDGDGLDDFVFAVNAGDSVYGTSLSQVTSVARGPMVLPWPFHYWRPVDGDALPDVETFGPYSQNLGEDCGLNDCPNLVHGPELIGHNTPFGFAFGDAVAYEYLASRCTEGQQLGETRVQQLARMVVCSRLLATDLGQIAEELARGRASECITHDNCPAFDILNEWLQESVPPEFENISDWANQCRSPLL